MNASPEKSSLRKTLLARRDSVSYDLVRISAEKIFNRIRRIPEYVDARTIACYYPVGSEVPTQDIMLDAISSGKKVCLPRVAGPNMEFREIGDLDGLESGPFDTMQPREDCAACDRFDAVVVPAVGLTRGGARLGYGHGYYDRFLAGRKTVSIALSYARQLVGSIPTLQHDVPVDWIVTEDEFFRTS